MALSLTDFQPGFIAQRTAGTTGRANLGISWQASAPGNVQARVVTAAGAVVADWQTCTGQTAAGGVLPGPVPQGDNYRVQIRDGAGGAVQAGANAWGVGVIFAFHGQSNMRGILYGGWTGQEMDLYNASAKLARSYYYTGWSVFGHDLDFNNDSLYLFGRELVAALGGNVPVGVVPVAENSRSIEAFLPGANGDVYYNFIVATKSGKGDGNAGYASPAWVWGGDLEGVFYHQGEADVGQTDAWYKARLGTLHQQFLTQVAPYGRTAATLLFCPGLIASETAYDGRNVGGMRRAVLSYVAERRAAGDAADVFSTADFATSLEDDLHFGEGDARAAMRRLVQHAKRKVGAASYGGRGPAIASMSRSGRAVTVAVAHDGGAALHTARGGAVSGFAASNDAFTSHKVALSAALSGNGSVTLALPAEFDGRAATIGYLQAVPRSSVALLSTPAAYPVSGAVLDGDTRPDVSNALYDDAAICPGVRGQSDPAAPGLPLLPTFGAWTLSDGQTVNAPAGAASAGTGGGSTGSTPGGTTTTPATPGKVTNLRVTSVSGTVIGYAWDAYAGAASYRGEMRARGGAVASTDTWSGVGTMDASTTSESKGGLVDNTVYELRVLARDSAGATIATSDTVGVTIGTPVLTGGTSSGAATGPWADAGTLRLVGPSRAYATIQAAVDAAAAGDTVIVDDGVYAPFRLSKRVLVRARNRLGATVDAKLSGSFALVDGKGAVLVTADGARLAGMWVVNGTSGAVGSESNPVAGGEAGVRVDADVGTFYLDGCRFDSCANGLFSGGTNTIYESNCEYGYSRANGATKDFKTHDIYVTGGTVLFETRNSWHYGNPTGHDIKSRSATTRVFGGYTVGKGIRNFDISDGGLFEASGAYITHDPANGQRDFLAIGPESLSNGANPNCKITGGTIVSRQSGMRVSLQAGVGLACSGVSQVWVNDGNGAPTLDLNAQGGTITGLASSPGGATVRTAMPAAPVFAYDASLAPGIAYTPAASTGSGTGTTTGSGTSTGGTGTTTGGTGTGTSTGGTGTSTGGATTTTPSTGNTTGAQVAYYKLDGKVALDAAAGKLIVSAITGGTGSTGGTTTGGTGTTGTGTSTGGTTTGGTTGTGTGTSTGGTGTGTTTGGTTTATPKVANLRVTSISGTTVYYAWDAYPGTASYRAEARARDGANATDVWGGIGTMDGSTTSESKGGLPDNTTYEFRITARDSAGATLAVSNPLTVVLGSPAASTGSGTSTGGTTGTGSTGGSAGGTTTVPPAAGTGAFSATYPWNVVAGGTDVAVQRVIGNAPGEVPAGHKLTAAVDGAAVTVQDLAPCTWPDGSRKAGVVSLTLPGARAAGSTATVVFGETAGAADATVSKSKAAIAADSDFELRLSGFDLDATYVLRVNDCIANATGFPYGTNPSRGLDVLDQGPERTRLRAWAFVRRQSDGAIHRTLKAYVYLDALKSGAYRAIVRWTQDTIYGALTGATAGPAAPTRLNFVAELFNKGTRVAAWGGPNDPRARTGAGATLLNNSTFRPPADFPVGGDWALGVGVGFTGGLPGELSASRVYWPRWGSNGLELHTTRRDGGAVGFGSGSGNVTVFPVMHSFGGSGGIGTGLDLHPVWVGPGDKPVVRPAHDRAHLFQRTRLTPPYRVDLQQGNVSGTPRVHVPGEVYDDVIWSIGAVGDDAANSRLGYIPFSHARLLYAPNDAVMWATAFSLAVSWADYPQDWIDERAGVPPVTSKGGSTDTGQTYPGFAPLNTDLENLLNDGRGGSPRLGDGQVSGWFGAGDVKHGYADDYQLSNSFAHTPNWWYVPYLLTGDQVWLDLGMANCVNVSMLWDNAHYSALDGQWQVGRQYTPIVTGQPRGVAWAFRDWSNWLQVAPDAHPYRQVLQDYMKINFAFFAAQADNSLGRFLGLIAPGYERTADWGGTPFHNHMLGLSLGMMLWRTGDADLRKAMGTYKRFLLDTFSDDVVSGGGWFVNNYRLQSNNWDNLPETGVGQNEVFRTIAGKLYHEARSFAPYPATGLKEGYAAPNSYAAMWLAATAVWSSAGVVGSGRVRKAMLRRLNGSETEISYVDGGVGLIPHYALLPVNGVD